MSIIRAGGIQHDRGEHTINLDQPLGPDAEALLRQVLARADHPSGDTVTEAEFTEGGITLRGYLQDDRGRLVLERGQPVLWERRI